MVQTITVLKYFVQDNSFTYSLLNNKPIRTQWPSPLSIPGPQMNVQQGGDPGNLSKTHDLDRCSGEAFLQINISGKKRSDIYEIRLISGQKRQQPLKRRETEVWNQTCAFYFC